MKFTNPEAEVFVPDGTAPEAALARTTLMGISAHQDDAEILAYHGIVEAYTTPDEWFTSVVLTNGSGSARSDCYAEYTDEQMREVRKREQKKAAFVGDYAAAVLLDYPSSAVKDAANPGPVDDLKAILLTARPRRVYTHNPADKHDTHVAVCLRLVQALRDLGGEVAPEKVYGVEVWRDLDWVVDEDKIALAVDRHENLAAALIGLYDSQIAGGKRYDLATMGRRRAHATYHASHATDECQGLTFAVDLTPLTKDPELDAAQYIGDYITRFSNDVLERLARLSGR
ncbi:MAG: PIG-L family deacetylase [Kiritimatiellaeota bacterium]|nr:PIG-L family deacetylase [Kiritimatiellota bacterium]